MGPDKGKPKYRNLISNIGRIDGIKGRGIGQKVEYRFAYFLPYFSPSEIEWAVLYSYRDFCMFGFLIHNFFFVGVFLKLEIVSLLTGKYAEKIVLILVTWKVYSVKQFQEQKSFYGARKTIIESSSRVTSNEK